MKLEFLREFKRTQSIQIKQFMKLTKQEIKLINEDEITSY